MTKEQTTQMKGATTSGLHKDTPKGKTTQVKGATPNTRTSNTRTSNTLNSMSLTDIVTRQGGGIVPGVADQESAESRSLYQVQEVAIADILVSDYQTRESVSPERFERLVKSMRGEAPKEFKDSIPVRAHPKIPGKWQIVRGGHTRIKAAQEAGLETYPVIIVNYDNKRSALGIARENLARADELSPPEEGRLYLLLKDEFGYTQPELAEELGIKFDRIKECTAVAQSAPDILDMFIRIKELGGDSNRGLRAAKCLRRMDILDEKFKQQGFAARLRVPLKEMFIYERLTTDALDIATRRVVQADDPEAVVASIMQDLNRSDRSEEQPVPNGPIEPGKPVTPQREIVAPEIQRSERLQLVTRRFRQFISLIGQHAPSDEERRVLINIRSEIDDIISR